MSEESIDKALNQIPGLKDSVAQRGPEPTPVDYFADPAAEAEEQGDPSIAAKPKVEDSDAVQAALGQIPGLRDRMGR